MLTPFILVLGLMVATAVIAYWSDNLGKKLGKKRVTLFGLRPKQTATLITIGSSLLIMFSTLCALLAVHRPLRVALTRYDVERRSFDVARATFEFDKARSLKERDQLQREVQNVRQEAAGVRQVLVAAHTELAATQGKLSVTQKQLAASQKQVGDARLATARESRIAKSARGEAAQAREREREAQNGARLAASNARSARESQRTAESAAQNARVRLATAQTQSVAARLQLSGTRIQLSRARQGLSQARQGLSQAKRNLQLAQADFIRSRDRFIRQRDKQGTELLQQEAQLASLQKSVADQEKQVEEKEKFLATAESRLQEARLSLAVAVDALAVAADALTGPQLVSANETLAERSIPAGQSADEVRATLDALLDAARTQARRLGESAGRLGVGVSVVPRPIEVDGATVPVDAETQIALLTQRLAQSDSPASVRVLAARSHAQSEAEVKVLLRVIEVRRAFGSGDVLASRTIDAKGDAGIFKQLLDLANDGQRAAEEKGVQPPLSREVLFYAPGTNERIFEALRAIQRLRSPARVRLVAADDLPTSSPLRVRFEVAPAPSAATQRDA